MDATSSSTWSALLHAARTKPQTASIKEKYLHPISSFVGKEIGWTLCGSCCNWPAARAYRPLNPNLTSVTPVATKMRVAASMPSTRYTDYRKPLCKDTLSSAAIRQRNSAASKPSSTSMQKHKLIRSENAHAAPGAPLASSLAKSHLPQRARQELSLAASSQRACATHRAYAYSAYVLSKIPYDQVRSVCTPKSDARSLPDSDDDTLHPLRSHPCFYFNTVQK